MAEPIDMEMLWGVPADELPPPDEQKDYFDYQDQEDTECSGPSQ